MPVSENDKRPKGRPSARLKLLAGLAGLAPFIALEIGLRLFGIGATDRASDPFAGFGSNIPVFEREGAVWKTTDKRMPFLPDQSFAVEKPAHGFRAFCFGGSTVHGRPYEADTAFPKWLELELQAADPERAVEIINCGGISYASYRIVPMLREILNHNPDLIVVATGHNEFLEDRTYHSLKSRTAAQSWIDNLGDRVRTVRVGRNLLRGKPSPGQSGNPDRDGDFETRLDTENGYASYHRDADWHARVIEQFEEAMRTMVRLCDDQKIPLLLINLGSNVRDCPPFKSEHRADLSAVEEVRWQEAFAAADAADQAGDLNAALKAYRRAQEIDGQHALLHWRLARCLDRLGKPEEAARHYLRAKDEDICPLRMFDRQYTFLTKLAAENGVAIVDARRALESQSPDGAPGNDWYLDHVHPTIGGHQEIARAIAARLRESGTFPDAKEWTDDARRAAYASHFEKLGPVYLGNGRRRLEWLEGWANRNRLLGETQPVDARSHLHAGFRYLDFGETTKAAAAIRKALELEPGLQTALDAREEQLWNQGRQVDLQ